MEKGRVTLDRPTSLVRRIRSSFQDESEGDTSGNMPVKERMRLIMKRKQRSSISIALSNLRYVVECLFCNFLLILYGVLLFPLAVIYFLLRKIEQFVVCLKVKAVPVPGEDAIWLQDSDTNRIVINSVMFLDKQGDDTKATNNLKQAVYERMVTYKNSDGSIKFPRAKQLVRPGLFQYFFVEDSNFDIDDHVFKFEGEPPKSKEELEAVVSKICSEPLPENRPLWYYCYIPSEIDSTAAVVFRIHHCVTDGVSLMSFITKILADEYIPQKEAKKFTCIAREFQQLKALFIAGRTAIGSNLRFPDKSIIHGESLTGKKNFAWTKPLDFNLVKRIKTATGTTVNDVLVASLTMAVRKYFQKRGVQNPEDFTACIPVDVSASREFIEFHNKFAMVLIYLPSSQQGTLNILSETKARLDAMKVSGEAFASGWILSLPLELLPDILVRPLITFTTMKATCVMSNLPGPQFPMSINGQQMKSMIFWPPQSTNIGVGFSIFSYAGQVVIGATGDSGVMSDPKAVTEFFEESIHELAAEVLGGE